jgi:UDPglucose 6-dehydrogenase
VRRGIGSDPRIGYDFLYAGCGYGGSCFPKDVRSLIQTAGEYDEQMEILKAVTSVNEAQKQTLANKIVARLGDDLSGKKFALWGLAFKPNTDDMRDAPSRVLIAALLERGASISAYDPVATDEARRVIALDLRDTPALLARLTYANDHTEVLDNADALIIVTEWKVFKSPDFDGMKRRLKTPLIFDGRNLYEPETMNEIGVEYHAIGRGVRQAVKAPVAA